MLAYHRNSTVKPFEEIYDAREKLKKLQKMDKRSSSSSSGRSDGTDPISLLSSSSSSSSSNPQHNLKSHSVFGDPLSVMTSDDYCEIDGHITHMNENKSHDFFHGNDVESGFFYQKK